MGQEVLDSRARSADTGLAMLLIQYRSGRIQEGALIAIQGNRLRIAVKGRGDVLVFRLLRDGWVSESHEIVTFNFPLAAFEAIGMVPTPQNTIEEQAVRQQREWETRGLVN